MKPLKIIELAFLGEDKSLNSPLKNTDQFYFTSWAGLIAKRIKISKPELDIESWISKKAFDEIKMKNINGITAIIWPYRKPVIKNILTFEMLKRLYKLRKKYFIVLHYHSIFSLVFNIFINFLPADIKVVLSHHGGIPPNKNTIKNILINLFLKKRNIKYVTYLTPETRNYIQKIKNHPQCVFLPVGADFNLHCGGDKIIARKKLGLSENKIYALYVGRFYKLKSVNIILEIYNYFKNKYNFKVIFVGGRNDEINDLYNEVVNSGCPYFGTVNHQEIPQFYQASDFYIQPAFNKMYGGFDVSLIESLANNRPVASSRLNYFDFDYSELGISYDKKEEIYEKTEYMINNFQKYTKCREISKKHLDGNTAIAKKLINIYIEIYNFYSDKIKN